MLFQLQLTRSRGAWPRSHLKTRLLVDFNSHAHVERDCHQGICGYSQVHFNSHAHVERDSMYDTDEYTMENFNSHAHVERDWTYRGVRWWVLRISTHTLTWSVTHVLRSISIVFAFQLTRSRGAWQSSSRSSHGRKAFQLTRSRGAWPEKEIPHVTASDFNSHAHVERDLYFFRGR